MKIQINQQEIETGIKYYIKNSYGIDINNADIKLTATRGSEGVIADIEINGMCGNSNNDTRGNETKEKAKEPQKEKVLSEETNSEPASESPIPSNSSKESKESNNSESEPKTSSIFSKRNTEPSKESSTDTEEPEKSHIGKGIFGQYQRNA